MALPNIEEMTKGVPEGGNILGVSNALTNNAFNQRINQAKAYYAPRREAADIASKEAYANFVGPQAIAQILTNPATRGMLSREQYDQLSKVFAEQVKGRGNAFANSNQPYPGTRAAFNASPGGHFVNYLLGLVGFGGGNQNQVNTNPTQQGVASSTPISPPGSNNGNDAYGNQQPVPDQEVENKANDLWNQATKEESPPTGINLSSLPAMPAIQRAAALKMPGTMGGENPTAGQEAIESFIKTGATAEANNLSEEWKDSYTQARKASQGAQETLAVADKMKNAFDEMGVLQRGRFGGNLPKFSTARQDFEMARQAVADAVATAKQTGHITGKDRDIYGSMKPDATMTKEAFRRQYEFIKGMSERIIERQPFDLAAAKKNLTPQQADIVWNNYIKSRPFYDAKNHKFMQKNIGTWEDFLEEPKLSQSFSPRLQKEAAPKPSNKVPPMEIWIPMRKPMGNGKYKNVEVSSDSYDEAIKAKYLRAE